MRVTVELTDEQADRIGNGRPGCESESMLRDAIVAARPKPLKVGDKVKYSGWEYGVIAIVHSVYSQRRFLIAERDDSPSALFLTSNDRFAMADGSPIVWPEP